MVLEVKYIRLLPLDHEESQSLTRKIVKELGLVVTGDNPYPEDTLQKLTSFNEDQVGGRVSE